MRIALSLLVAASALPLIIGWLRHRSQRHRHRVLAALGSARLTGPEVADRAGLSVSTVYAVLTVLEERGRVTSEWGSRSASGFRRRYYVATLNSSV